MTILNNKNHRKPRGRRNNKVEKTIKVVKETEFVQRDEFHNVDDPLPGVSPREAKRKTKQVRKPVETREYVDEKETEDNEVRRVITLTKTEPAEVADEEIEETVSEKPEEEVVQEEVSPKKSKKNKNTDDEDDVVNITDIRAARKKEKSRKRMKKIIILGVVAVFAASVYATKDIWVPKLEGILDRPHDTIINDGKTLEGNFPIEFDENSVNTISYIDNLILRVDDNHIELYDENGNKTTTFSHNYEDPIVRVEGKRMLVYDNGGNNFEVLNKKNQVYEKTVDQQILLAAIAKNSNVAVVTQTEKYASVLTVYDSNGSEIYNWSSNMRVLNVSFTNDGSGCYISTFDSQNGEMQSKIHYISFDSTQEVMQSETLDTLALDVCLNDNDNYWVVGDTKFYKLDNEGKILLEYEYTIELVDYAISDNCAAVVFNGVQRKTGSLAVFSSDSTQSTPDNVLYTDGGYPKKLKISSNKIILLKENEIEAYDDSGNLLATAAVSSEYVDFTFLNENVYFLGYREINKISFAT